MLRDYVAHQHSSTLEVRARLKPAARAARGVIARRAAQRMRERACPGAALALPLSHHPRVGGTQPLSGPT